MPTRTRMPSTDIGRSDFTTELRPYLRRWPGLGGGPSVAFEIFRP